VNVTLTTGIHSCNEDRIHILCTWDLFTLVALLFCVVERSSVLPFALNISERVLNKCVYSSKRNDLER